MRLVGLGGEADHALAVEVVELLCVRHVKTVAKHGLGWVCKVLVVQAVLAAEVGNAAVGGYAGAGKEYDVFCVVNDLLQFLNFVLHWFHLPLHDYISAEVFPRYDRVPL